jgi:hypothetical protein
MKELSCRLVNDVRVETEEIEGANYLNVYIPHETDTDKETLYSVSIDDWSDSKLNKFVHVIACLTAEEVEASFVYDDITECGIEDALYMAKRHKIGWIKKEDGDYIQSTQELAQWILASPYFAETPATLLAHVDTAQLGKDLVDVENVFVYVYEENKIQRHIGEYYKCHNRILFHIVG